MIIAVSNSLDKARETLLNALDALNGAAEKLEGPADRVDLVVVYDVGRDMGDGGWEHVGGWAATPGPTWTHFSLLEKAIAAQREIDKPIEDDED
jgi:hypothetical protein